MYAAPLGLLLYNIARDGRALVALYDRTIRVEVTTAGEARPRDVSWRNGSFVRDISRDGRLVLLSLPRAGQQYPSARARRIVTTECDSGLKALRGDLYR